MNRIPGRAATIVGNLIQSIRLIGDKTLPKLAISGNIPFETLWDDMEDVMSGKKR